MKLPIQLQFKKQDDRQCYLSLLLSDEKTHATIFSEHEGKIAVVGEKEIHFHKPLEQLTEDELIDILDKTISSAESSLPDGFQTRKTIFGVKESWIEDTKIKKTYLAKLKKVCDTLGLTPIGFLVSSEAIAHLLQKEEGAPVSAILVEDGNHEIAVSVLRAGKLLETKRVPRGESIAKTIDKTLHHFTSYEILPSRLVIFNTKNHEKISQEIITHQWSKSLPFLHVPQIKILPNAFESRSLLFGAATQMGFEMVDKYDMPTIPTASNTSNNSKDTEKVLEDNFGFVQDTDVAQGVRKDAQTEKGVDDPTQNVDPKVEEYNQDFFSSQHQQTEQPAHKKSNGIMQKIHYTLNPFMRRGHALLGAIPIDSLTEKFPMLKNQKKLIFLPPIIVGVILLFFLFYIFGLKATVVLHTNPKTIKETQDITFSTREATDPSRNIIAVETISTSEEGTNSTPATGKKKIGEKAKGTVTILSSKSSSQSIPTNTSITASNGLVFTIDKDVTIASSSGISDIKSVSVSVTAKDIGKEYNLPSGTPFSVAGFDKSSVEAKNTDAFSGGSEKEITVVAKADTAKLLADLPKKLTEKARSTLKTKVDTKKTILPVFSSTSVEKESFDKDVGEEASSVTLDGTVTFNSAAYTKSDIDSFAISVLSSSNTNLIPAKESISYKLSGVSEGKDDITATLAIQGFLLPKVEKQEIASDIAGKSFEEAKQMLLKLPQVKDVDIQLSPPLFFFPSLLPRMPTNITVEVETNG